MAGTTPKAAKRASIAKLLPAPPVERWGVHLALQDYSSDKEYRIVVSGNRTIFQWGVRSANGQVKVTDHADAATATAAARKQWAAKEAKGYWPVTGALTLGPFVRGIHHGGVVLTIDEAFVAAVRDLAPGTAGDQLWLCQAPPFGAAVDASAQLAHIARAGGLLSRDEHVRPGGYVLVAVDEATVAKLAQVCPVALPVGERTERSAVAAAEIARTLCAEADSDDEGARETLANALEIARLISVS